MQVILIDVRQPQTQVRDVDLVLELVQDHVTLLSPGTDRREPFGDLEPGLVEVPKDEQRDAAEESTDLVNEPPGRGGALPLAGENGDVESLRDPGFLQKRTEPFLLDVKHSLVALPCGEPPSDPSVQSHEHGCDHRAG